MITTVAVIGAGQAAAVAVRTLRRRGFDGRIEIVGDEPYAPYQRPPLSKEYLAGGDPDGLFLLTEQWCTSNEVRLRLGQPAMRIATDRGVVELADGCEIRADAVLVATGGRARRLPDTTGDRILNLRTMRDSDRLRQHLGPGKRLAVIGAGFIGAEVAATARGMGADVTIVESLATPLLPVLGARVGAVCAELHREHGVELRLGETVHSVVETTDGNGVVITTSGGRVEADIAVIGIGIQPNVAVAQQSGIDVANGILVDEYCRTNVPNVFAAGDVANHYHPIFRERMRVEHFDNANKQAAAAADNILGRVTVFDDPHWFWSDQYDHNLQYAGHARTWDELVVRGSEAEFDFSAFYLRDGVIRAAFGLNRGGDVLVAKELIARQAVVEPRVLQDEDVDLADLIESTTLRELS